MSAYYFDTSALVKRYAAEVGSVWVQRLIARHSGNVIYASVIAQAEAISALLTPCWQQRLPKVSSWITRFCVPDSKMKGNNAWANISFIDSFR